MDLFEWWIWCVCSELLHSILCRIKTLQLANRKLKSQPLDLAKLQEIVKADSKQRYNLVLEGLDSGAGEWWIRANQGHSMKASFIRPSASSGFLTTLRI